MTPKDPYDEDGYCEYCGNGSWRYHALWCAWADADRVLDPQYCGMQLFPPTSDRRSLGGRLVGIECR